MSEEVVYKGKRLAIDGQELQVDGVRIHVDRDADSGKYSIVYGPPAETVLAAAKAYIDSRTDPA